MIASLLSTPAAKNLIANMPIVILFKAVRGAFAGRREAGNSVQGSARA